MNDQHKFSMHISDFWIMAAGMVTTALALLGVYLLSNVAGDFNIMGWYALFIVPAGAILVGIAAGSGYGLVSWLMGRKVNGSLLAIILALLVIGYGSAQYVEFTGMQKEYPALRQISFFQYYDATTRSMTFSLSRSKTSTGELGILGYLFRFLELAGFAVGGLVIPLMLKSKAYCERCGVYMRKKDIWWLAAAVPNRKIPKKDAGALNAYVEEMKSAFENGMNASQLLIKAAQERNVPAFQEIIARALPVKEAQKLEHRIEVRLNTCPRCADGIFVATLNSGHGDKSRSEKIAGQPVDSGFTRSIPTASG